MLHPARDGHPTPMCVLLLLKPPLCLWDTGSAQSQLSCTSPTISLAAGWIQEWLPMGWGRAELLLAVPMVRGAQREGTLMPIMVCNAWGEGRHGMCGGAVAGGRPRGVACRCF